MQQIRDYGDERNKGWCVFCGGLSQTRDHVPSKILLESPYPENLPVVTSCGTCNSSFSLDEEYLACLIECATAGSVEAAVASRPKIAKALARKPSLATRLSAARNQHDDFITWKPEEHRVYNVIKKLARGHIAFEQNEPQLHEPASIFVMPLCSMSDQLRERFETPPNTGLWPEVGSRAMHRVLVGAEGDFPWIEVQPDRYRYLAVTGPTLVRIVIGEYLAAEVVWD